MKKYSYLSWLLILIVAYAVSWAFIDNFYDQQVLSQHQAFLQQKANTILRLADDQRDLKEISENYILDSDERITYLDAQGDIIFDTYDTHLRGQRSTRPEVRAVLNGRASGHSVRISPTLHKELLYIVLPIKDHGKITNMLRLAEPTTSFLPNANQMKHAILFVFSLFWFVLSSAMLYILHKRNRPIETILPVLQKMIESPDRQETIIQDSPQWRELYRSVNTLSEQLSQTYQAYNASERQLYTLLNELTIGIFMIDSHDKLVIMNQTMQEQLNSFLKDEEQPFTHTITHTDLIQMIYRVKETKFSVHEEIHTAQERVLDVMLRYFEDEQQILGISYDLTRIYQLEKLQKDFVGNVSHELKTPVTSLIGFTETLLDGAKEDPETLTTFLKIMQKDAYRLENLILEIIQLSKNAEISYPIQTVSVGDLLSQVVNDYQATIQEKQLTVHLDGSEQVLFTTQKELFQPICKNLIENAVNYSLPKGTINITYEQTQDQLLLTFQDFGIGIPQEEQTRIFERFYRVDKARSRNSGGTGLGLAIVHDYISILEGSIHIDSHPGIGSTFTVTLPLHGNK